MGKAIRWLKGLFGMKKPETDTNTNTNTSQTTTNLRHHYPKNDKKGSSFGRSEVLCHNPATIPPNLSAAEAAWLRSFYSEDTPAADKEQSRHAIAVAAATAAAADAAVVAAQAAAAVVRLTTHCPGRGAVTAAAASTTHERWASLRIQTVFRGYLARKALRALKGLVKLQAVVRGYLVRKQATATLHSMQALIRAQATVRSHRNRSLILNHNNNKFDPRARKSMSNLQESNNSDSGDQLLHVHHSGGQIPCHSRRLSASLDPNFADETPKIVEVDTGRPKSRSRRTNASMSDFGDDPIAPVPVPAPVGCYYQAMSSPLPCRRIAVPTHAPADCHYYYYCGNSREWGLTGDECRFSTAQSTPRFCGDCSSGQLAPPTPAKSVCGGADYGYSSGNCPNYMSNTKSFKAKLRSYSAPKQRPDPSPKKRLSLNDMMESRTSLSGVRMQRSCSQVQEGISFKNAVMGKLEYRDRNG